MTALHKKTLWGIPTADNLQKQETQDTAAWPRQAQAGHSAAHRLTHAYVHSYCKIFLCTRSSYKTSGAKLLDEHPNPSTRIQKSH